MAMFYRLPEARALPARARRYDDKKRCMPPGVVVKSRRQRSDGELCTWILFCSEADGPSTLFEIVGRTIVGVR